MQFCPKSLVLGIFSSEGRGQRLQNKQLLQWLAAATLAARYSGFLEGRLLHVAKNQFPQTTASILHKSKVNFQTEQTIVSLNSRRALLLVRSACTYVWSTLLCRDNYDVRQFVKYSGQPNEERMVTSKNRPDDLAQQPFLSLICKA